MGENVFCSKICEPPTQKTRNRSDEYLREMSVLVEWPTGPLFIFASKTFPCLLYFQKITLIFVVSRFAFDFRGFTFSSSLIVAFPIFKMSCGNIFSNFSKVKRSYGAIQSYRSAPAGPKGVPAGEAPWAALAGKSQT